jgi:phosphoribosylaminoimidazole-succinocarboxamide synthase
LSKKKILEGKTKKLYTTDVEDELVLEFKNDYPISKKNDKLSIKEKASINKQVSSQLLRFIESYHIPTHFLKDLSKKEMLVNRLDMISLEFMARNIATGSLVKRYGLEKGKEFDCPVIEIYLKNDSAEETLINRDHIVSFGYATSDELKKLHRIMSKMNVILRDFFRRRRYKLADFKIEFGRVKDKLIVGDEISLDTMSLFDLESEKMIEKDSMDKDPAKIYQTYKEFSLRVLG